jgi:hypothetical protein
VEVTVAHVRRVVLIGGWLSFLLHTANLPIGAIEFTLAETIPAPGNNLVQLRRMAMNIGNVEQ